MLRIVVKFKFKTNRRPSTREREERREGRREGGKKRGERGGRKRGEGRREDGCKQTDSRFLKRESRTASAEASLLKSVDQETKVWLVAVTGWGREAGREEGKEGGREGGKWLDASMVP